MRRSVIHLCAPCTIVHLAHAHATGQGPSRATAGPRKPLLRGPITTLLCMRRLRDREG